MFMESVHWRSNEMKSTVLSENFTTFGSGKACEARILTHEQYPNCENAATPTIWWETSSGSGLVSLFPR
ncbi:hypothetical protein CLV71_124152 [Actinophytocola oryzae]|uniref:Uncharacterized protein n=1 Tax=Actinophytocola oryzae TaxID=502181 RepID=A0A4R7UTZ1_9PSEU|nr:hypothetical protein CLV71_124152 [Actinophytocola oryzae]